VLPRWRGAAPIHRAIEAGDSATGITIMQMDEGLDTGDMLLVAHEPIQASDTTASLHDRLAALGAQQIVQALAALEQGSLTRTPQPEGANYAHKIDKTEAALDWSRPAAELERRLRAFDPFPGCTAEVAGHPLKLWRGRVVPETGAAGQQIALPGRLVVACGQDALELLEVQPPGGRRMPASEFLKRVQAS
jgi:methionyl-tRNA formyltransferase